MKDKRKLAERNRPSEWAVALTGAAIAIVILVVVYGFIGWYILSHR